ncbi:Replication factor A protein 1 [Microsporum audouinii]
MFDDTKPKVPQPILQCLRIKPVTVREQERFGVVFSDVVNFVRTMLPTQLNNYVTEGLLRRGSFVRLTNFQVSVVKGKQ